MRDLKLLEKLLIVVTIISSLGGQLMAEKSIPFYNDGFDTTGLLVENFKLSPTKAWSIENGKLVTKLDGVATATLKQTLKADTMVEVEVTPLKVKKEFAGIIFRGINFLIRPSGFWYCHRIKGKKTSNGGSITAKINAGQTYKFKVICKKLDKSLMFTWFVDGKKIAEFIESGALKNKTFLSLFSYKMPVAYDNLAVSKLVGKDVSPNLLTNGSFEYMQEDLLLDWKPIDQGSMIGVYDSMANFWKVWHVDDKESHSGKQSLRLEVNDKMKKNGVYSGNVGVAVERPIVYSVYLKSDTEDFPVRMVFWEWLGKWHYKDIKVGKEWKRYEFVLEKPQKNAIRVGLNFTKKGVVWMDSAQVESGVEISKYTPSALDIKFNKENVSQITFPAKIAIPKFAKVPVLDGKIGKEWDGATKINNFLIKAKDEPTEKTVAFVGCDNDNLYIAFRCFSNNIEKIKALAEQHDHGAIWSDDIVELFFDTNLDRHSYFHLAVNSKGIKSDVGPSMDLSWTGPWEAVSSVNKKEGYWETEIKIPLSILGLDSSTSDEWGINYCRGNPAKKEYSATAQVPELNFHKVSHYGSSVWPEGILKKFAVEVKDLKIIQDISSGKYVVSGKMYNLTGKPLNATVQFFVKDKPVTGKEILSLKDSKCTSLAVPYSINPGSGNITLVGKIFTSSGNVLTEFRQIIKATKSVDFFSQRNYYMNEKNATLVAKLNFPDYQKLQTLITLNDSKGKKVWETTLNKMSETMRIPVPISAIPAGKYKCTFTVKNAGKALIISSTELIKRKYQANGVQIDRERLCIIVNGRPFLPIAPLMQFFGHTKEEFIKKQINHFANAGFKTMMTVMGVKYPTFNKIHHTIVNECDKTNMKLILWPAGFLGKRFNTKDLVENFGKAPALIAWMPVDEPELYAKPEDVIKCITEFQKEDPYHPAITNNTVMGIPARFAGLTNDILSIDDYLTNRANRKVSEILEQVANMAAVGAQDKKPSFMFLVGNNLHNHNREPSTGEQVASSYGTIISGASGIYYFLGQPTSQMHWNIYKQTNKELLSLTDIIYSLDRPGKALIADKSIISITRKYKDYLYVISVNIEDQPVNTKITIPAGIKISGKVEVLFENRKIDLKNNTFNDSYKPHQRHVYKVKLK